MILPTKKQLKNMQQMNVCIKKDKVWLDNIANEYKISLEEAFKLYVESDEEYIYLNENFNFTIKEVRVFPEDWDGGCQFVYRCFAKCIKL